MRKLFTKYLFIILLIPVLLLSAFYWLTDKNAMGIYGVNRTINFSGIDIDEVLTNPLYNSSAFVIAYPTYVFGYLIVFLFKKSTNFSYSILNFTILILNYILLCNNPENRILIPLTIFGLIIFILNIFRSKKIQTTINKQPSII